MFAVIKTGGKQYRVAENDVIVAERLDGEPGDTVDLDVLMSGDGADIKEGGSARGEIVEQRKGGKITVFKKKRRSTYRRTRGHRQLETVIRVTEIGGKGGAKKAAPKTAAKKAAPKTEAEAKPAAAKPKAETKAPAAPAADDLTRLNGVGPAYAKKLVAQGVTTFAQIAAWTDADVDALEGEITGLKAKVEKDDLIGQAKQLAKER